MAAAYDIMAGAAPAAGGGWGSFGQALGQAMSGRQGSSVYDETMLRGHRTQRALKEAQKATLQYQSMMDLEEALSETFGPELARAAAATSNAGGNFQQLSAGRNNMLQGDALSAALQGVQSGQGLADVNPLLAVAKGEPVPLAKVEGNNLISPYEALSGQTPTVSPYGEGYLANQAQRVAGQNRAAMARATRPPATRNGGAANTEEKARKDDIKATARQAYYQLRERAREDLDIDPAGITLGDIEYALETTGQWTSPAGDEYVIINQDVSQPLHEDLAGAIAAGAITPPAQVPTFPRIVSGASSLPAEAAGSPRLAPGEVGGGGNAIPPAPAPGLPAQTARGSASPAAAMSGAPVTEPKGQPSPGPGSGESLDHIPRLSLDRGGLEGMDAPPPQVLPAAARAALKEGKVTTFANGQAWTLRDGVPVRVR